MTLKPCPCGKTPQQLHIAHGDVRKWDYVSGDCCGEWEVEFRTGYVGGNTEAAERAWNEAERAAQFLRIISVEDDVPPRDEQVLMWRKNTGWAIGQYFLCEAGEFWIGDGEIKDFSRVTHWARLPDNPETGAKK